MKKIANAEKYVVDIVKELPPSPHTRRFREELLEHMADAEEDLRNQENNLNQIKTKVMKKIGDKDALTKSYVDFYRSRLSKLWPIELLVYIVLSVYVFFVTLFIMNPFSLITDSSLWILKLIIIAFSILLGYIFDRAIFNFIAKRLSPHISSRRGRILVAFSLVIIPTLLFLQNIASMIEFKLLDSYSLESFAAMMITFVIIYVAIGVAFNIIPRHSKKVSAGNTKIPYVLLFIFLAIMFFSISLAEQKTGTLSAPWQFIDAMSNFLTIPIVFLYSPLYLTSFVSADPATSFKFFAALLVVLGLGGIGLIVFASKAKTPSQKNWRRAVGVALFFYSVFILLPIDKARETVSGLNISSVNVTKEIEQNQQGLLYPALKFTDQAKGGALYMICRENNLFTIVQTSETKSNYFLIDTNNAPKGQTPAVAVKPKQEMGECIQEFSPIDENLPQGFECPDCVKETERNAEGDVTSYSTDMTNLSFHGHKFFVDAQSAGDVSEIKVSDNQEWALIQHSYDQIDLVDLRSLK